MSRKLLNVVSISTCRSVRFIELFDNGSLSIHPADREGIRSDTLMSTSTPPSADVDFVRKVVSLLFSELFRRIKCFRISYSVL